MNTKQKDFASRSAEDERGRSRGRCGDRPPPAGMVSASAPSQDENRPSISIFRGYGRTHWVKTRNRAKPWPGSWISYHAMHPNVTVNHAPIDPGAWDDIQQWAGAPSAGTGRARPALRQLDLPHRRLDVRPNSRRLVGLPISSRPNPYVEGNMQWADQFIKPGERQSNGPDCLAGPRQHDAVVLLQQGSLCSQWLGSARHMGRADHAFSRISGKRD